MFKKIGNFFILILKKISSLAGGGLFLYLAFLALQMCTGMKADSMDCGSGMNGRGYCGDGMGGEIVLFGLFLFVIFLAFLILGIALMCYAIFTPKSGEPGNRPSIAK